jgi:predicted lipid-binding transport protein (Tim44 family)
MVTPTQDLILTPDEVIDKSTRTTRLLSLLARTDPLFDPEPLRERVQQFFCQVQQCWEARQPGSVRDGMTPEAFTRYEELVSAMRLNHEVNRIEDLQVRRIEYVYVASPPDGERPQFTALITFEAKAHFIHETSGAYLRGAVENTCYQELWTFQRSDNAWLLHEVKASRDSTLLHAPNKVAGLTDEEVRNPTHGTILL